MIALSRTPPSLVKVNGLSVANELLSLTHALALMLNLGQIGFVLLRDFGGEFRRRHQYQSTW